MVADAQAGRVEPDPTDPRDVPLMRELALTRRILDGDDQNTVPTLALMAEKRMAELVGLRAELAAAKLINEKLLVGGVDLHDGLVDIVSAIVHDCIAARAEVTDLRQQRDSLQSICERLGLLDPSGAAEQTELSKPDCPHGRPGWAWCDLCVAEQTEPQPGPKCVHCGGWVDQRNLTHKCPVIGYSLSSLACVTGLTVDKEGQQ